MVRDCSIGEFLRAVKRSPKRLVRHDVKNCVWSFGTNKCLWICTLDNSLAGLLIDKSLEMVLAKIPDIIFEHYN